MKQPETNHKETGFTHPTGHLKWGETGPTEAQNPTVRGYDLLWLSDFSQKSVETSTISIFFFFLQLCGHTDAWIKGSWESTGTIQPLPLQWWKKTNNIMIYDTDEDQKTVKLETQNCAFCFFGGDCCELGKTKKKLNRDQDCFQFEKRSRDTGYQHWERCSSVPWRHDDKYLYS